MLLAEQRQGVDVDHLEVADSDSGFDVLGVVGDTSDGRLRSGGSNWMAGGFDMVARLWAKRRSRDDRLPDWLRVHYYAMSRMRSDGHCAVTTGELAKMLGKRNMRANTLKSRVIDRAVELDLLSELTNSRCLVLPYDIRYMTTVDRASDCGLH